MIAQGKLEHVRIKYRNTYPEKIFRLWSAMTSLTAELKRGRNEFEEMKLEKVALFITDLPTCFNYDDPFMDRPINVDRFLIRNEGNVRLRAHVCDGVKVSLCSWENKDNDEALFYIWRPSLDLANYLWPDADIWSSPEDENPYLFFIVEGQIKMISTACQNL